jgi:hypothetical protein
MGAIKVSNYRPLPHFLTIKPSETEGLGLFSTQDLLPGTRLGPSHYILPVVGLIRTPLGGFINHSDTPNCTKVDFQGYSEIITKEHIKAGDELLLKYKMYDPT